MMYTNVLIKCINQYYKMIKLFKTVKIDNEQFKCTIKAYANLKNVQKF